MHDVHSPPGRSRVQPQRGDVVKQLLRNTTLFERIAELVEDTPDVKEALEQWDAMWESLNTALEEEGLDDLRKQLMTLDDLFNLHSTETLEAAWLWGFRHGRDPESLLFEDKE